MAMIKCKMCGGEVELSPDKTFGTCEYCGSTSTFPKVSDEQRASAFNRGNHFRRIGEFDKALAVYERIVQEDDTDAEAHWCCALCRFGIEYVEDPVTYEWLPTCHRASFDSFLEDVDYKAALEHSDGITQRQYMKDAARISEVQRGILATSQSAEPFDVFICYKESDSDGSRTRDSIMAQDIYYQLTEQGHRVFFARITLEDVPGTQYEPYIFAALNSAKVMIVVGTKPEYLNAVWVKNEWSRFLALMRKDRNKVLLPCYRDMDPYDMPEALSVLQSYDMSKIGFIQDLTRGIAKVVNKTEQKAAQKETVVVQQSGSSNVTALMDRGNMALEDGDWEKADSFFEDVLNNDAKNAQAYLGKALAQEHCRTLDAFIRKRKDATQNVRGQTLTLEPNQAHVDEMAQKCTVPGYVTEESIRELYTYDLSYHSDVEARKEQLEDEEDYLEDHQWLSKAVRFATGALAETLAREKTELLAALDERVKQAEAAEAAAVVEVKNRYATHLRQADEQAEILFEESEARRESDYNHWVSIAKTSTSMNRLKDAVEFFEARGDYKDSKALAEHCYKRIADITAEQERLAAEQKAAAEAEAERQRILKEKQEAAQKAKNKKIAIISAAAVAVVIAAFVIITKVVIPGNNYKAAEELLAAGQYDEAIAAFEALGDYKDSADRAQEAKQAKIEEERAEAYAAAESLLAEGKNVDAAFAFGRAIGYSDADQRSRELWEEIAQRDTIDAGWYHTVGLKSDGTVVAVGDNDSGQCDVSEWTDIVAISAGYEHTVGLKADGTVVAVGWNKHGQCDVDDWSDVVAISAGGCHTLGLKSDGNVVAVGSNNYGQCGVSDWTDIVAISAGDCHTLGLKSDGTVVAVGYNDDGQCRVSYWTDIVAISAGNDHTVGLKADGTVVAVGRNFYGECDVSEWTDIVAISAGGIHTVGLKADGTVVAVGSNKYGQCDVSDWTDIVAISAGYWYTVGLKADGTVVAVGDNDYGQCDVSDWTGIKLPE